MQTLTRPNGSVTAYQYDVLNRLTQTTTTVSGVVVSQYAYTYNAQDLRDSETTGDARAPYAAEQVNYTYNNVNALTQIDDPVTKTLTYDASGNLTQGYTPEGYAFTAAYDSDNHLTNFSYTDGNGVVNQTQYYYLAHTLFRKVRSQNGAVVDEKHYTYDGNLIVQERDGAFPLYWSDHVAAEYT